MIKGVGRVRARVLWNAGLRGIESVRRAPLAQLERMLGPKLAKTIKEAKLKDIREKV
jgi:replicative superfamily II helicase